MSFEGVLSGESTSWDACRTGADANIHEYT